MRTIKLTLLVTLASLLFILLFVIVSPRVEYFETTATVQIHRNPGSWSGYVNSVTAGTDNASKQIMLYTGNVDIKAGKYEINYTVEYVYNTCFDKTPKTVHVINWVIVDGMKIEMQNASWNDHTWTIPCLRKITLLKQIDWIK